MRGLGPKSNATTKHARHNPHGPLTCHYVSKGIKYIDYWINEVALGTEILND